MDVVPDLKEDGYGEDLSEWVVSSESFAGTGDGPLLHFFDKTARRNHGPVGSGKLLTKEARKCHKGIPVPHANSAVFVCFAEERMDLCRAIVTGPVDTPYAHGIFVMDVYFPPTYPQIPPLVQWMTTGE
jgi:baculoviral IAP repeat-containing protein 6